MHQLVGYHRPESIADALRLLDGSNRVALAGGTTIRHDGGGAAIELVDLQALGLGGIDRDGDRLHLGATVTLQALVDDERVPRLIRDAARAEQQSTLRSLATVGGTIGAPDGDSLLLAALLVHDASIVFGDDSAVPLETVLRDRLSPTDLIVGVAVASGGTSAIAATGRTPGDRPIVAALARVGDDGIRLALCGVGPTPRLADPAELDHLEPTGDFRGSPAYRSQLARVLSARVMGELS